MEVLEKPIIKHKWIHTVKCEGVNGIKAGCGASLSINEDDLFRVKIGNFGFQRFIAQFQCPECGVRTDFQGYPNPSVLLDYWQHAQYSVSSDLAGYEMERFDTRIWSDRQSYLESLDRG